MAKSNDRRAAAENLLAAKNLANVIGGQAAADELKKAQAAVAQTRSGGKR